MTRAFLALVACYACLAADWRPSPDCGIKSSAGPLVVESKGKDPFITTSDLPDSAGPFVLHLRMKTVGKGGGEAWWSTADKPGYDPGRRANFAVTHSGVFEEYRIPLPVAGKMTGFRLDPQMSPGTIEIDEMLLTDVAGIVLKQWVVSKRAPFDGQAVEGDASIRAKAGPSEIVVTTTNRLAGAIHSLTWNGKEFIDSHDHGRQLQSASSFSDGKARHHAESYNPTEAGSRKDGAGPRSTSKLLFLRKSPTELQTLNRMAFWLAADELSEGHPAINKEPLSNHLLGKRVRLGHEGNPHILPYDVTFSLPVDERWGMNQFEALTGYMPAEFDQFHKFVPGKSAFEPLTQVSGEQTYPVALATQDGAFAMGIFARDSAICGKPSYGRFYFPQQKTMKWNAVFRKRDEQGLKPGDYSFSMFVLVGSLEDVRQAFVQLHK